MRIIAYTYEADVHCPECARERFGTADASFTNNKGWIDEHGISDASIDGEGNPIHPVFDIDEDPDGAFTHCGDCHEELT